jgi:hypothetical protein
LRFTESGKSVVSIIGDNVNILEHASNTALALRGDEFMLVTTDGEHGCTEGKPTCGMDDHQLAAFLIDFLDVTSAMSMDQGGRCVQFLKRHRLVGVVCGGVWWGETSCALTSGCLSSVAQPSSFPVTTTALLKVSLE